MPRLRGAYKRCSHRFRQATLSASAVRYHVVERRKSGNCVSVSSTVSGVFDAKKASNLDALDCGIIIHRSLNRDEK